jgi:pyruvate dehydrogenase E1 component beta subunit
MAKKSYRQAINEALRGEMQRDSRVVVMGEDVAGGAGGSGKDDAYGGVLGVTKGLVQEFGRGRVIDTPITESAIMGMAAGAAASGLRPVAELMFVDFLGVCFDQIFNQAAKFRYMFGGKARAPLVIRAMIGAGFRAAAQHSQCLYSVFTHIPGLKVVIPSTPYDAKGLLIEAIRDDDPVIFLEHKLLYDIKGEVPDESYTIPFGQANVLCEGGDVTIVAFARMVHVAMTAAENLKKSGIQATVIDPRTTSPFDEDTIVESVGTTGRLVVVDESTPRCSMASEVAAMVAERAFRSLRAPVRRITAPHTPVPFSPVLEDAYIPSAAAVEAAVREMVGAGDVSRPEAELRTVGK